MNRITTVSRTSCRPRADCWTAWIAAACLTVLSILSIQRRKESRACQRKRPMD
ncbi:MAG TPA: hypothetical protein VMT52_18845 [Planctomycetota bacterium]|nr:hypothetical protein [Planctomycetota bacterium]